MPPSIYRLVHSSITASPRFVFPGELRKHTPPPHFSPLVPWASIVKLQGSTLSPDLKVRGQGKSHRFGLKMDVRRNNWSCHVLHMLNNAMTNANSFPNMPNLLLSLSSYLCETEVINHTTEGISRFDFCLWRSSPWLHAFLIYLEWAPAFSAFWAIREETRCQCLLKPQLKLIIFRVHLCIQAPRVSWGIRPLHCLHVYMEARLMSIWLARHSLFKIHIAN